MSDSKRKTTKIKIKTLRFDKFINLKKKKPYFGQVHHGSGQKKKHYKLKSYGIQAGFGMPY